MIVEIEQDEAGKFIIKKMYLNSVDLVNQIINDPCERCNGNPKNNPLADGMCVCDLPTKNKVVC
jgi:hypothetical protein